jgi:hypothetical protein
VDADLGDVRVVGDAPDVLADFHVLDPVDQGAGCVAEARPHQDRYVVHLAQLDRSGVHHARPKLGQF